MLVKKKNHPTEKIYWKWKKKKKHFGWMIGFEGFKIFEIPKPECWYKVQSSGIFIILCAYQCWAGGKGAGHR